MPRTASRGALVLKPALVTALHFNPRLAASRAKVFYFVFNRLTYYNRSNY